MTSRSFASISASWRELGVISSSYVSSSSMPPSVSFARSPLCSSTTACGFFSRRRSLKANELVVEGGQLLQHLCLARSRLTSDPLPFGSIGWCGWNILHHCLRGPLSSFSCIPRRGPLFNMISPLSANGLWGSRTLQRSFKTPKPDIYWLFRNTHGYGWHSPPFDQT